MAERSLIDKIMDNYDYNKQSRDPPSITVQGVTLTYDKQRFQEDPGLYVAEQLSAHQEYHKMVEKELSDTYSNLHQKFEREGDLERALEFIPENMVKPLIGVLKFFLNPVVWITTFRSLRRLGKEAIQLEELDVSRYKLIESVFDYGKVFINYQSENDQLSDEVKVNLNEWKKVQDNLFYLHSRLVNTAQKSVEVEKRFYKLLYPDSEI